MNNDDEKGGELVRLTELFPTRFDKEFFKEIVQLHKSQRPLTEIYADQPEELAQLLKIIENENKRDAIMARIRAGSTLSSILIELQHLLSPEEIWAMYEEAVLFTRIIRIMKAGTEALMTPEIRDRLRANLFKMIDDDNTSFD